MTTYAKEGADRLGVCDPKTGRCYQFDLPHTTKDEAEIRALKSGGAVVAERPPKKKDKERETE